MSARTVARYTAMSILTLGLLACLLAFTDWAHAQKAKKKVIQPIFPMVDPIDVPNLPGGTASLYSAIKLVEEPKYRQLMDAARDYMAEKNWKVAVPNLQRVLEEKENHYVQLRERDAHGRETVRWTSVKFEANKLIGDMPNEGLDFYELEFGATARDLLDEAKKSGDRELLARVAQSYTHTRAGIEANDLLATFFLDRGQYFMAALRLEKILEMRPERTRLSNMTLFKAALAYRRSGDVKRADEVWKRLEPQLRDGGMKISDQLVPVARLKQMLEENAPRPVFANVFDWPMIRGNEANAAQALGSQPALDYTVFPARPTIRDKGESGGEVALSRLEDAMANQRALNGPVMSGFFPIVANKMVIYRSHNDIRAVALQAFEDAKGRKFAPGDIVWKGSAFGFENSLVNILDNPRLSPGLGTWMSQFNAVPGFRSFLYENSLLGTIATDKKYVYAIDDLAIPAPPAWLQFLPGQPQFAALRPRVLQNVLSAFDLTTGKEVWKLGVRSFDFPSNDERENPFFESHFLSVPISVGGKLYVLNERNRGQLQGESDLRLVCIDPNKKDKEPGRPAVVSIQELATVQQHARFTHDPVRRTQSAHMAYGEGVLVCTTNAGEVLGIDLLSRSLAWSYPYREQNPATQPFQPNPFQPQPFPPRGGPVASVSLPHWKSSPPVIQEGKVVFTASDATSVHCINLRDGTGVWKRKQAEGDLFLAGVFSGKVVIVGKNAVRVLRLSDGTQLWQEPTLGMPSGQGVCSKNVYYLPLRKADKSEIVALDLERLAVKSRNPAMSAKDELGNLVFHEGMVLSQTPLSLTAYPELKVQLELASKDVLANPDNPVALFKRGKWLLADGQVQPAVDDLRTALIKNLPADMKVEARKKLFLAFTDLMQVNFKEAHGRYQEEYREVCNVPNNDQEQQERLAKFYRVVGEGHESLQNLVEAFQIYREFGALPLIRDGGVVSPEDPSHKVPINVWLRGRIAGMMSKAPLDRKAPLEAKIAEEWQVVKARKDIDAVRSFVDMFDTPVTVGREARLHLAEIIVERSQRNAYLEAELNLQQLRASDYFHDPNISARALAALARLEEKKNSAEAMKLAAAYYRELRRDFAEVDVANKQKGKDLLEKLETDPRYLHLLQEPGPLWTHEKLGVRELKEFHGGQQPGFVFQPAGDLTPLVKQHRLLLDINVTPPQLRCYNFASNNVRWTLELAAPQGYQVFHHLYSQAQMPNVNQPLDNFRYNPNARFRFFQVRGNLAVIQAGTLAYCLDMDAGKILWHHSLFENPNQPNMIMQPPRVDAEGNIEMVFRNQFNGQMTTATVGHVGAVQASYVALITHKGLVVLDPLRGTVLWRKPDVPIHTRVFGDDHHLCTVEEAGGIVGAGRAYRAIDGTNLNVPDFSAVYQSQVRIVGRKILAATPNGAGGRDLRLHDCVAGKDLWVRPFNLPGTVLQTEDAGLTGMIEANGQVTALEADTGRVIFQSSVVQGQVTAAEAANLEEPWLLQDRDRYYLALNEAISKDKVFQGVVFNNFGNGLRCRLVNGWVLAFFREDGEHSENGKLIKHKKGEFHWHSPVKMENQMVVLEQFDNLPVLLFSARFVDAVKHNLVPRRNDWMSHTVCLQRSNGKRLYIGSHVANQGVPFSTMCIQQKEGTVSLVGFNFNNITIQLYVDDGRKPAQGARLGPAGAMPAQVWNGAIQVHEAAPPLGPPVDAPVLRRAPR